MGHKRIEIKNIVEKLLFKNTICDENIFIHRFISFEDDYEFPSISIYTDNEEALEEIEPCGYLREVDLYIVIYNRARTQNDTTSDLIANQIEARIAKYKSKDFTFRYIKTKYDVSVENCVSNNETTILTYRVKYDAYDCDDLSDLDDLKEINIKQSKGIS